jgi:hypothetical protein
MWIPALTAVALLAASGAARATQDPGPRASGGPRAPAEPRGPAFPVDVRDAPARLDLLLGRLERQLARGEFDDPLPEDCLAIARFAFEVDAEARARAAAALGALRDAIRERNTDPDLDPAGVGGFSAEAQAEAWASDLSRALDIGTTMVELGPEPTAEALLEQLRTKDRCRQFAALSLVPRLPSAERGPLAAIVERLAVGPAERRTLHTLALDGPVRVAAARLVPTLPVGPAAIEAALCLLLDLGDRSDRLGALRGAVRCADPSWRLRVRVIRSMLADDEDEAKAAVIALGGQGIRPPAEQQPDRAASLRALMRTTDPVRAELLRESLAWGGPTEGEALAILARLAADARRPSLAKAARAVLDRFGAAERHR